MADDNAHELINLTADIVSSMVSNNKVATDEIAGLIQSTYEALATVATPAPAPTSAPEPAVSIKQSVKRDFIVCLEDGKKLKMLKRYLRTNYDMTPEQYREKWNLPKSYPMVAPAYAEQRRSLAVERGLGRKLDTAAKTVAATTKRAAKGVTEGLAAAREHLGGQAAAKAPPKRGRPPKKTKASAS